MKIVIIIIALAFNYGCAGIQATASAGAGWYTHKRIDKVEEKAQPDRIDALADSIKVLEWQIKALERAIEGL